MHTMVKHTLIKMFAMRNLLSTSYPVLKPTLGLHFFIPNECKLFILINVPQFMDLVWLSL